MPHPKDLEEEEEEEFEGYDPVIYELHYAPIELTNEIPCLIFHKKSDLVAWVDLKLEDEYTESKIVYLVAMEGYKHDEVFVSDDTMLVLSFIDDNIDNSQFTWFLQEYKSYEEAYKVALDIQETKPNCYEN